MESEKLSPEIFERKKRDFDHNYEIIKERIKQAAEISGRKYEDINLLAATKTVSPELINYGISKGISLDRRKPRSGAAF